MELDIVDGGMVVGEKILLSSNSAKQRCSKINSAERKTTRASRSSSARKSVTRYTMKSREGEKDSSDISSSISSDSESDGLENGPKNVNTMLNEEMQDSCGSSRKDSGLPSSRYICDKGKVQAPVITVERPFYVGCGCILQPGNGIG